MKNILSLFLCILVAAVAEALPVRRIATYSTAAGFTNAYVTCMAEDSRGFLWVGTERGLFRLDGYRAVPPVVAGGGDGANLVGTCCSELLYDRSRDCLWVGSRYDGLFRLDLATGRATQWSLTTKPTLGSNTVTGLALGSGGGLWIATFDKGLFSLNAETGVARQILGGRGTWPDRSLSDVAVARDGMIFAASYSHGLIAYNPVSGDVHAYDGGSLPARCVRCVLIDGNERVWCGTYNGLALFSRTDATFRSFALPSLDIMALAMDKEGHLWLGTEEKGMLVIDRPTPLTPSHKGRGRNYSTDMGGTVYSNNGAKATSLPLPSWEGAGGEGLLRIFTDTWPAVGNKTVKKLFVDSRGNICAGTYGDGVDVYTHTPELYTAMTAQSRPVALSQREVRALVFDPTDGSLWVGMDGAGIDVFTREGVKRNFSTSNSALTDGAVLAACRAGDGSLWFATYHGKVVTKPLGSQTLQAVPLDDIGDVRQLSPLGQHYVIAACVNGIIIIDTQTRQTLRATRRTGTIRNYLVRTAVADNAGRIYAGTESRGLDIYDRQLRFLRHLGAESLPSLFVADIKALPDGTVYIGSNAGLTRYSYKTGKAVTVMSGTEVRSVTVGTGCLWLTLPGRILRYDLKSHAMKDYTFMAGGVEGDFAARAAAITKGRLCFGSNQGLCLFAPYALPSVVLPPVRFSQVTGIAEAGGQGEVVSYRFGDAVVLPPDGNTFTVAFSVLDPQYADKVEYAYQLEGLGHGQWLTNGRSNTVTFHNLPHGTYRLRVRARMPNMPWGKESATLQITVKPPLWLTWWAKLCYALIVGGVIAVLVVSARRRLHYRNGLFLEREGRAKDKALIEERMRFFTNITHELRTPLSLIIGPLDDIMADKALSAAAHRKLSMIQKNAERLLSLINSILEFRKTETQNRQLYVRHADMATLVSEQGLRYRELNTNTKIEIRTEIAAGDYGMVFDSEAVTTIIDNLMSNACKYTEEGEIVLSLRHESHEGNDWTTISVRDTGCGIRAKSVPHVFERYFRDHNDPNVTSTGIGLALTQNLVRLHEGEIGVESRYGHGSTFTFRLLTHNVYPDANHRPDVAKTQNEVYAPEMMDGENGAQEARQVVLVVEDNEEIRQYVADTLADDYLVHVAADGSEGLEKARELVPDIIVTDVMMPVMDGMEMSRRLKKDVATSHIPIIILTAKASVEDRTDAYVLGAESFIPKPFTARLLRSRIANILEQRQKIAAMVAGEERRFSTCVTGASGFPSRGDNAGAGSTSEGDADTSRVGDADTSRVGNAQSQLRRLETCAPPSPAAILAQALSQIDREFIERVDKIIDENLKNEELDVSFIASRVAMSYSTLYRKMKAITGLPANQYVRRRRIRRAAELLLTARYTVSEVAVMSGFNSMSNFRTLFRTEYGVTPTEYIGKDKA